MYKQVVFKINKLNSKKLNYTQQMNNKIVLHSNANQQINYKNYFKLMQIIEEQMLVK